MAETSVGPSSSIERVLWRVVLVLLIIGLVLSVWSVLGGRLSPPQVRILLTAYGVSIYAAMGLGCSAVLRRQPTSIGARVGIVVAAAAGVLFILGIWWQLAQFATWWRLYGITTILSLATCHASLLLLVRLDSRFNAIRAVTRICIYAWALLLTFMIVINRGDEILWRLVGLAWTVSVFGTLAMPVLTKLSAKQD